ncbi:trigger factor [Persicirhabdus sediminis]|uniref:Trigger factor n=1 Tax=Persicirhabdus sediminis TaxID=454144 RepID=A0A8J7MEB6_9BACT|nr:trigger factor [Persicirhabdus sediminis]MBK1791137.1 trigger factor [Persicirhabdus sediminis]
MNITVEKQAKCTATMRAEIPADKVNNERKAIVKGFAKQAKIPGFRPGKTPLAVVEKRFADGISEELEQRLVNEACSEALKQNESLKVLNFKKPESLSFSDDGALSFSMDIILAPEIELCEYKGIEIPNADPEATEEEIQKEIDALAERYASYDDVDRDLAEGDIAVIDFTSSIDGKSIEEVTGNDPGILAGRDDYWVMLKDDAFLPGFASQLVGLKKNDAKEVKCTIGEEFPMEDLRGVEVTFNVTVKEAKEQKLPVIDDEFAANTLGLGEEKTLEDVKDLIKGHITSQKTEQISNAKVNAVVEHLIKNIELELPQDLLDLEVQSTANDMRARGASSGLTEEQIAAQEEEIQTAAASQAGNNLKTNFILQEIAGAEGIKVDDQELTQRIIQMATQEKKNVKTYIKELQQSGRIDSLRNSILVGKTIDFLIENAKLEDVEVVTTEADA